MHYSWVSTNAEIKAMNPSIPGLSRSRKIFNVNFAFWLNKLLTAWRLTPNFYQTTHVGFYSQQLANGNPTRSLTLTMKRDVMRRRERERADSTAKHSNSPSSHRSSRIF
jgi:hypothetical protein